MVGISGEILLVGLYKYWWGYNTILSMGFKLATFFRAFCGILMRQIADSLIMGVVYLDFCSKRILYYYIPTNISILYPQQYYIISPPVFIYPHQYLYIISTSVAIYISHIVKLNILLFTCFVTNSTP